MCVPPTLCRRIQGWWQQSIYKSNINWYFLITDESNLNCNLTTKRYFLSVLADSICFIAKTPPQFLISLNTHQTNFQSQQGSVFSRKISNKPTVSYLLSTRQHTDKVCYCLVNIMEHLAAKSQIFYSKWIATLLHVFWKCKHCCWNKRSNYALADQQQINKSLNLFGLLIIYQNIFFSIINKVIIWYLS